MTSRVRETAPAYGSEGTRPQPVGFKVTVGARGRLVLPAEVREKLKITEGDWLTLVLEPDGVVTLMTGEVWTDKFIEALRHSARHVPRGRSLVDGLIAERRREAAKEEREFRKTDAFFRKQRRR